MPAKKKINNESKTTEINVKSDMKRCKQVKEKLNECIDIRLFVLIFGYQNLTKKL